MKGLITLVFACALAAVGCDSGKSDGSSDGGTDGGTDGGNDDSGTGDENRAFVFEVDPVSTPDPVEVVLANVADDADGKLTSALDEAGIRKLMVHTCLDEGATNSSTGYGEQRICTLVQLADKEENGDFGYTDWEEDVAGVFDPDNVHSEVNLYYHADKIYEFVTSPEVGVFTHLPGRHEAGGESVPLHLIANYQSPVSSDEDSLAPTLSASFITDESLQMGMSFFLGLEGIRGDALIFGQASNADFAYAGETVYHEFGHAIVNATADIGMVNADAFGVTNMARTLDEGIANTFAFLVSGEDTIGEYLSQVTGYGFTFFADNDATVPCDLSGHSVSDGNAVMGANREILSAMTDEGLTREAFTRILLLTLEDMYLPDGDNTYVQYAQVFEDTLQAEGHGDLVDTVHGIFEGRGLTGEARVKELGVGCSSRVKIGGAEDAMWNTTIDLASPEAWGTASTAYLQLTYVVPAGASGVTVTGDISETSSTMASATDDWDLVVLARSDAPVEITYSGDGTAAVAYDSQAPAVITGSDVEWTLSSLTPGQTVYMLIVNRGVSDAWLNDLAVSVD